jgi:uncharacterized protein YkwD
MARDPRRTARRRCALLVALVAALMTACARPAPRAPADPGTRDIELEVIRLTNAHRRARALPPLREDPVLAALARGHSRDMARAEGIGHDGLRGRFRHAAASLPLAKFAENVARTGRHQKRAQARWVVGRWIESDVHRVHLEEGAFGRVGVGVVRHPSGALYFTQLFAAVREPPPEPAEPRSVPAAIPH